MVPFTLARREGAQCFAGRLKPTLWELVDQSTRPNSKNRLRVKEVSSLMPVSYKEDTEAQRQTATVLRLHSYTIAVPASVGILDNRWTVVQRASGKPLMCLSHLIPRDRKEWQAQNGREERKPRSQCGSSSGSSRGGVARTLGPLKYFLKLPKVSASVRRWEDQNFILQVRLNHKPCCPHKD